MKIRTNLFTWTTTVSLLILTTVLTTSCGGTKTETATKDDAPKTESPKAGESPKAAESPKAKAGESPKASESPTGATFTNETTKASAGGDGKFIDVKIDKLETYTHPGGVFSMDIPEGWTKQDSSKPDEVIIAWTDPAKNSLVIMDIFEVEATPGKEALGGKLKEFITGLFGTQPKFAVTDAKEQPDGTMRVEWSYEVTVSGQSGILLGNSFIEQKGNKVAVFSAAVPKGQFDGLKDNLNKIIASRKIDPSVKIAKQLGFMQIRALATMRPLA